MLKQFYKNRDIDIQLNLFEVLQIAEQIERNGARFYLKAAELFEDSNIIKLLRQLADWEKKHIEFFSGIKEKASESKWEQGMYVPSRIDLPNTDVMSGLAVFGIRSNPADELRGNESQIQVLKIAIEKEKDSIIYYTGIKDFIRDREDRNKINDIIKEEMRHIRILKQSLQQRHQ